MALFKNKGLPDKCDTKLKDENVLKVGVEVALNMTAFRFGIGRVEQDLRLMAIVQTHTNYIIIDFQRASSQYNVIIIQHVFFLQSLYTYLVDLDVAIEHIQEGVRLLVRNFISYVRNL